MTGIKRRTFLTGSLAGAALGATAGAFPRFTWAQARDKIRIGTILDLSGPFQPFGMQKKRCLDLAVEEINQKGGLLGRQLELVSYDAQSNNQLYAQYATQLGLRDKVSVVQAALQSSSREVIRPILRRSNTLYFYNTPYEGGVCDRNTFCTGTTPGQLLANMLPFMINRFGKKIYVLAADYNFGQLSEKWTRKLAKDHGGEVIASEFFPLDVAQFGPTISKIQAAKPDFIVNTFVGPAHAAFYGQWTAAGMKKQIPIASQTFGEGGEVVRMPPEVSDGIFVCYSYMDEIDTPANQAFIQKFKAKHGADYGYLGDLSMSEYMGIYLWAEGVKKAGKLDRNDVIKALESNISLDMPGGKVTIDPLTHHCIFDMYLAVAGTDRKFKILQKFPQERPTNPGNECDLVKNPNTNTQFEAKI
jgi:branched-chain amino acid transport system substrate-binding protein